MMHRTLGEQIIELLTLCQQLQSEKDSLKRPVPRHPGVAGDEVMDGFSQRILQSCACASSLDLLLAMQSRLGDAGRRLEEQGQLQTEVGDNYVLAALALRQRADLHDELPNYLLAAEINALFHYIPDLECKTLFATLCNRGACINEALPLGRADFLL